MFYFSAMKKIIVGIVLNAIALYLVTIILKDIHYTGGVQFFLIAGLIIGTLNTFIRPLMKLLSLPLMIISLGLFTIVINVIIFWLTMKIVDVIPVSDISVTIENPWTYLVAAFFFGFINWIIHRIIHNK